MKILLTGGSSFTGAWFAGALRKRGHEVVATLRSAPEDYSGVRFERVQGLIREGVQVVPHCCFGDENFRELIKDGFDVLCHHGAHVENYKSLDFDVHQAVLENSRNLRLTLESAKGGALQSIVLTGSVFEQDEGLGSSPLRAFSPYGLSKGLTWQTFRFWAEHLGVALNKFVIPNPFGPWEEPRFCAYLMQRWSKGEVAQVNTPDYVRDNIHVSLLAEVYAVFVERVARSTTPLKLGPSGYVETQGAFAQRFAREIGNRLNLEAGLQLATQTDFSEPVVRINPDRPDYSDIPDWNEQAAWDSLAHYYARTYLS